MDCNFVLMELNFFMLRDHLNRSQKLTQYSRSLIFVLPSPNDQIMALLDKISWHKYLAKESQEYRSRRNNLVVNVHSSVQLRLWNSQNLIIISKHSEYEPERHRTLLGHRRTSRRDQRCCHCLRTLQQQQISQLGTPGWPNHLGIFVLTHPPLFYRGNPLLLSG